MKKIAIIGSHKVGKTHLVSDIFDEIKDKKVYKINEQSRDWIDMFEFDWRKSDSIQHAYFEMSLYYYFSFALRIPCNLISDRTQLDALAYARYKSDLSGYEKIYIDFIQNGARFLDDNVELYFYRGHSDDDGKIIESYIEDILGEFKLEYIEFNRENYDEIRKEIISKY